MGKRNKVTTRDIALATHVSQSTVSMILSDNKNVSFKEETVKLVKNTAKQMGYKKPVVKKRYSNSKNTIVVICANLSNSYYSMVVSNIIQQASKTKTQILTISTLRKDELEKHAITHLKTIKPTGIILLYPPKFVDEWNQLSKQIPCIIIGDKPKNLDCDSIELNSFKCGKLLGSHLKQLGHKKIAYISSPLDTTEIGRNERYEGVKSILRDTQVFFSSSKQFEMYAIEKREYENGYHLTKQILGNQFDAYIGNNDMTALGILACLKDNNIKASVAGFDNIPEANFPQIQLTTVDHGGCEKGMEAVDILLEQTKSERKRIVHMEYEPQLIIRLSTFSRKKSSSQ